jgi:hypothetical protein
MLDVRELYSRRPPGLFGFITPEWQEFPPPLGDGGSLSSLLAFQGPKQHVFNGSPLKDLQK